MNNTHRKFHHLAWLRMAALFAAMLSLTLPGQAQQGRGFGERGRHRAAAGLGAHVHQPSSTLILPDWMSFLICSSFAFTSGVAPHTTMSEAAGPIARPKGL